MTAKLDIESIEARAEAASPAPWIMPREDDEFFQPNTVRCYVGLNKERILLKFNYHFAWEADRAFVQAAREDIPALCAALREALETLDRASELVNNCACTDECERAECCTSGCTFIEQLRKLLGGEAR